MRLTIFSYPKEFFKFWYEMHKFAINFCGNWFGVLVLPWGRIIFLNDDLADFIESKMTEEKEKTNGIDFEVR